MPLTDIAIRNAKPAGKLFRLFDARGLFLNCVQCDMRNFQFVFNSEKVNDISGDAV